MKRVITSKCQSILDRTFDEIGSVEFDKQDQLVILREEFQEDLKQLLDQYFQDNTLVPLTRSMHGKILEGKFIQINEGLCWVKINNYQLISCQPGSSRSHICLRKTFRFKIQLLEKIGYQESYTALLVE